MIIIELVTEINVIAAGRIIVNGAAQPHAVIKKAGYITDGPLTNDRRCSCHRVDFILTTGCDKNDKQEKTNDCFFHKIFTLTN